MIDPDQRFELPPHVVARELDDETVLLDLESGTYFGLNAVGSRILQLLADGASLGGTRDTLVEEFDAPSETIERDLATLVATLLEKKLILAEQ